MPLIVPFLALTDREGGDAREEKVADGPSSCHGVMRRPPVSTTGRTSEANLGALVRVTHDDVTAVTAHETFSSCRRDDQHSSS